MFDCSFYWNKYVVCVCSMFMMIFGLSFSDNFKILCCANEVSMKNVSEPTIKQSGENDCPSNNTNYNAYMVHDVGRVSSLLGLLQSV